MLAPLVHPAANYRIVVCCVNLVKLLCMLYSIKILSDENPMTKPLSTLGDAINSFLLDEDTTTRNLGLIDRVTLAKSTKKNFDWAVPQPRAWTQTRSRLFRLVSKKRMFSVVVLYVNSLYRAMQATKIC